MKNRIDKELVERQLITSRTRAQELIESGYVKCNNKIIYKCNYLVSETLKEINNCKYAIVSEAGASVISVQVLAVFAIVLYKMVQKKLLQ